MKNTVQSTYKIWGLRQRVVSVVLALAVIVLPAIVATRSAQAQTFTLLHTFAGPPDGFNPTATLVQDAAGNLYGTTAEGGMTAGICVSSGGRNGCGTVFKLDPTGAETVLYRFTGGTDGLVPTGLVLDAVGNLYGGTLGAGISGSGTVFKLDPAGTLTILHNGGSFPLVIDAGGNLYGTSSDGIFKLDPAGTYTVLAAGVKSGALALDAAGNLYGTTEFGGITGGVCGNSGCGTVFKLDRAGTYTVLYSFTGVGDDGYRPIAGVVLDAAGNLYGTTPFGGALNCIGGLNQPESCGIVFKLSPSGVETVFSLTSGDQPFAGLVLDTAGNLYGTTRYGSKFGTGGTVFTMNANGMETVLHAFTGFPDGQWPLTGVVLDPLGNVYGTTSTGGPLALGTAFKINQTGAQNLPLAVVIYGSGRVNGNGLDCSSNCATWVSPGTTFTLTATPPAGGSFVGWVPPPCSGTGTCSVTVNSAQTVGAAFDSDFSVSATALTPTAVSAGGSATSTINVVAAANGFFSAVALTCSVTPAPALAPTCSISPSSVLPGTPATLTVRTTGPTAAVMIPGAGFPGAGSERFYALCLPLMGLVAMAAGFGSKHKSRKKLRAGALICMLLAGLVFQIACGSSSSSMGGGSKGTPAGTYTITVTGTYSTGSLVHTTPTMLTVQ